MSKWSEFYASRKLTKIPAVCLNCQKPFETFRLTTLRRKCCSVQCARQFSGKTRHSTQRAFVQKRRCEGCGAEFLAKLKSKYAARFHDRSCSVAYFKRLALVRKQAKAPRLKPICQSCGGRFVPKSPDQLRCSRYSCRIRQVVERQCLCCSKRFIPPKKSRRIYCGKKCLVKATRQRPSFKGLRKALKRRRRARLRGVTAHTVYPHLVFQRDGWRCQLCGRSTPKRLQGRMCPTAPELDHIIPLALGGEHSYTNTQCLCRECNGKKGAKTLGQLRLAV